METIAEPLCPVFGTCGGCAYQDRIYPEELRLKENILREILGRALGLAGDAVAPIMPSPEPYHYRSHLDLAFVKTKKRGALIGFQPLGRKFLIPIDQCAIARKEISDFIPQLKELAEEALPAGYRNANLVVKAGDTGPVRWGGIGRHSLELPDSEYLVTEVHGRRIYHSLNTFFQANFSILNPMIASLRGLLAGESDALLFDLYAGVGLFGITLADLVAKVVMVEENKAAVRLARFNILQNGLRNVTVERGRVEDLLPALLRWGNDQRKIAFLDPPRRGLASAMLRLLAQHSSLEKLFYLSCQPESLAQDLRELIMAGWRVGKVHPFDFFPKTRHLESLAVLTRPLPREG
jgi:tRNA/tmRNA/rRNA uracil-C5-methylase (TrmA/RlmC/RlmD family)